MMGFFSKLLDMNKILKNNPFLKLNRKFNQEKYHKNNEVKIKEFKQKYDLSTVNGIRNIPISEAKRYSDGGESVVYMPEQILNRQATEYKKEKKYELAIECLRKANDLYPHSFYSYTRDNYERIVDMMVLAGKFKDARKEHQKLDYMYGTRLDELKHLQLTTVNMGIESERDYQIRVIDPYIEEANSKEQYYWLLENIPEIAPKSFGGYRMMKKKKTDNYLKIVSKVKETGNDIDKLKFWL